MLDQTDTVARKEEETTAPKESSTDIATQTSVKADVPAPPQDTPTLETAVNGALKEVPTPVAVQPVLSKIPQVPPVQDTLPVPAAKRDVSEQSTAPETPVETIAKQVEKAPSTSAALMTAQQKLLAQEQKAIAEAQIDIVEKVEAIQTKDAAMATEERMFADLDKSEATDSDIMSGMTAPPRQPKGKTSSIGMPVGDRWAIAAPGVDLSGDWKLVVTDEFKSYYDEYLKQLGQPFIVRSVALTLIGLTTEYTEQKEGGRTLFIRGTNARGVWERTLVTSGADMVNDQFSPLHVPVETADDERVEAEAWWEDNGTVHRSWMRGLNKYGGGSFESKRYLDEGGKVLVCESTFHPNEKDRKDAGITWRFLNQGETLDAKQ